MKKLMTLIFTILLFNINYIYAYELTYSQWSEEYPDGVFDLLISSEDRFLCYDSREINEQYLTKEDAVGRIIDYDDYIYTEESDYSTIKPDYLEDRVINERRDTKYYTIDDIYGISFDNFNLRAQVYITEFEIVDFYGNKVELNEEDQYKELFDNDYDTSLELSENIRFTFKEKAEIEIYKITIYYNDSFPFSGYYRVNYIANDNHNILSRNVIVENDRGLLHSYNEFNQSLSETIVEYSYVDKLYRTYEIEKVLGTTYHRSDECEIDESSMKRFYRYVMNDYIVVDRFGYEVKDYDFCKKSFCAIKYLVDEEEKEEEPTIEIVNNPKTIDNIYIYITILIMSLLILIFMFIRFKKNKKYSLVNKKTY